MREFATSSNTLRRVKSKNLTIETVPLNVVESEGPTIFRFAPRRLSAFTLDSDIVA